MTYGLAWLATGCATVSVMLSLIAILGKAGNVPGTMYAMLAIALVVCVVWAIAASPIGRTPNSGGRIKHFATFRGRDLPPGMFAGEGDPFEGFSNKRKTAMAVLGLLVLCLICFYSVTNRSRGRYSNEVDGWSISSWVAGRHPVTQREHFAERRLAQREFGPAFMALIFAMCALVLHHRAPEVMRDVAEMERRDRMAGR